MSIETVVKPQCFEDILSMVGTSGYRNFIVFYACCIGCFVTSMHTFAYQFLGATPDYWCKIPELSSKGWTDYQIKEFAMPSTVVDGITKRDGCTMRNLDYTNLSNITYEEAAKLTYKSYLISNISIKCAARDFASHPETIVTKWDLVCSRRALYSSTQAAIQGGMLIGAVLFGYLIDKFGRLYIYKICVITYLIIGFGTALSTSIGMFIIFKVVTAMLGNGFYMAGFVLSMEFCAAKQRSSVSNYYVLPWAFGIMFTPAIAYLVPTWYWMEIALTAPGLILLLNFCILSESPRWLIMHHRMEEAYFILSQIAAYNQKTLPDKEYMLEIMENIHKKENEEEKIETSLLESVKAICRELIFLLVSKQYRTRTWCVLYCFFSVSLVYYGVSQGSVVLSTSDYLYIFLGGVIEIPSYLLLWPAVVKLGRKKTYVLLYMISAFSIFSVMILAIFYAHDKYSSVKLVLYLCGKFAITATFHLAWVYTAELYPTKYRTLILGEASGFGRIGSICSPYINDILGLVATWAPAALFGVFSITAGLVALVFPETTNKNLPGLNEYKKETRKVENDSDNPAFSENQ